MKPNEMRIGKPYIVTKGSDDGTFDEGDHVSIVGNGDVLCDEAGGWIGAADFGAASVGMEVEIDYVRIEAKRKWLAEQLAALDD